jgi:stress response protein SCP2
MVLAVVLTVLLQLLLAGQLHADEKCKVDDKVKFLLKNMNDETVKLEVDCVTGVGECDDLGKQLKLHAKDAVRAGKLQL